MPNIAESRFLKGQIQVGFCRSLDLVALAGLRG